MMFQYCVLIRRHTFQLRTFTKIHKAAPRLLENTTQIRSSWMLPFNTTCQRRNAATRFGSAPPSCQLATCDRNQQQEQDQEHIGKSRNRADWLRSSVWPTCQGDRKQRQEQG
ncbi:hypothetical protein NDU88_007697 [Pleurodeles waltl]|uniref:Uncharacterized protein n=1 Tax=Pleurodeles waltl TaxID=8319 RepID=A0AAV7NWR2_PLEWA|nr:hypothetical protein NDU88_007697 [Pleurodeles waltl]